MYPLVIIILHILFTFSFNNSSPVKSCFHLVSPVLHIQNLKPVSKYKKRQKHETWILYNSLFYVKTYFWLISSRKTIPVAGKSNKHENMLICNSSVINFFPNSISLVIVKAPIKRWFLWLSYSDLCNIQLNSTFSTGLPSSQQPRLSRRIWLHHVVLTILLVKR